MNAELNPYAAPREDDMLPEGGESEIDYLHAYIGPNSHYYLDQHQKAPDAGRQKIGGFNIAALFLSILWMGYRKLYWVALLFTGFMLAEMTLEMIVLVSLGLSDTPGAWDIGFNLAVGIFLAFNANRWYLAHARREVKSVLASGLRGHEARELLSRRGGTSVLLGLALGIAFVVVSVAYGIFVMVVFYGPSVFLDV